MEIWKNIKDTDGVYQISSYGRIRSIDHFANVCGGGKRLVRGKIIQPTKCVNGYLEAQFHYKGKRFVQLLHRLVAETFIANPQNLKEVNHKDENILNNAIDNLEWCDSKYNANYGTRNKRCSEKNQKQVNQYDIKGNFIKTWNGIINAEKSLGIPSECIIRCCKGKQSTSGGFVWKYSEV